jgi:hypothetical protein
MAEIPAATAAIDFLCRGQDAGVIVLGLCSGAYLGFHTALADKRVRGLALVNQQKYVWVEGMPLSVVQRNTLRNTSFYMQGLKQAHVWRRLLRGEIHVRRIAPVLAGRVLRRLLAMAEAHLGDLLPLQTETGRVRRWFQALYRRNVRVQVVLSPNDPGIDELEQYFGAGFARLRRFPNVSLVRLSNADHTLSTAAARQGFTDAFTDWLRRSFGLGRTDAVAGALLSLRPGALPRDDAGEDHPSGHPSPDQAVPMPDRPRVMGFRPMWRPWADPAGSRS